MPDNVGLLKAVSRMRAKKGIIDSGVTPDGMASTTHQREQPVHVYHLQYGQGGKVVDYHIDTWRMDIDGLSTKLEKVYPPGDIGEGLPVWVLELPEDAKRPEATIPCDHQQCPVMFVTEEQKIIHMGAHHRDFFAMQQRAVAREEAAAQRKLLEEQIAAQNKLIAELMARK